MNDLWDVIERYVTAEGLELDDVEWAGRVLRVTIDAEDGVDVERLADVSTGLSRILDDEEMASGSYTLEVSSPGLERKLRRPAHFAKAVGREVALTTRSEIDGDHSHRGRLEAYADEMCVVRVGDEERRIPLGEITAARTVFRWEPAAKPGKKREKTR